MGKKLYVGKLAFGVNDKDLDELFAPAGVGPCAPDQNRPASQAVTG